MISARQASILDHVMLAIFYVRSYADSQPFSTPMWAPGVWLEETALVIAFWLLVGFSQQKHRAEIRGEKK